MGATEAPLFGGHLGSEWGVVADPIAMGTGLMGTLGPSGGGGGISK